MNYSQSSILPFWDIVDSFAQTCTGIRPPRDIGSEASCFRIYPGLPEARRAVAEAVKAQGQPAAHSVLLQGRRAPTLKRLVQSWGDALEFPSYYGENLAAFDECFRDLLDIEDGGLGSRFGFGRPGKDVGRLVLTIMDVDQLLIDESLMGLARFIEHLQSLYDEVCENPRASVDLKVVLHPNHGKNILNTTERLT